MPDEEIPDGVALVLDQNALTKTTTGAWRIKDDRLDNGPPERIKRGDPIKACCKKIPHPFCSGVIVRCSSTGGHNLVTAGHCDLLSLDVRSQAFAIVGLRPLSMEIPDSHVLPLGGLIHYEDLVDRDLTIVRIPKIISSIQAHDLPPEGFDIAVGQAVYVVGHPGGIALQRFSAKIVSRIPKDTKRSLRGMNLEIDDPNAVQDYLSGSPVFDAQTNTLLGVIQGRARDLVDRLVEQLIEQFTKVLPLDDVVRPLAFWAVLRRNRLADDATSSIVLRSALERRLPRAWRRVDPVKVAQFRLEGFLDEELIERTDRIADLLTTVLAGNANAVALRGVLSCQLY